MPAGPVGSVWASGSWEDTAWEAGAWADAADQPATLGDLTTLFSRYLDTLRDDHLAENDTNTLVRDDRPNVVAGTTVRNDENTMYAQYLS